MNIFDTLFPPRSRAPSAAAGRSRGRQPVRRNRLARFSGEKLEDRLALAVVTPFTPVFAANLTGNISFAANTLMTAPGDSPEAIAARNGTGPQNTLNDDYWNMAYVDIDSDTSTFNSSSADLVIPVGANVEFARLYWGGRCADTVPDPLLETVKFKVGAGAYATLTGALVGKVVGGVVGRTDIQTYQCYVDVKSLVTGAGTYTVANVQGQEGAKNTCNGWSLVVAYSAPGSPGEVPRNLTVFQGFADVNDNSAANRNVTIPYSGFQAPQTGPVNATLGFVTYEGDLGITGDQAYFKSQSSASETLLSDVPANPANNFFNSTISNRGLLVTSKNPDYVNQFGFDADLVTADNIIQNGDTGAQIRVTSTQDQYYPGVITSAIDIYQPGIAVTKTVEDLNGGVVDPGDTLEYTVQVSNAAGLFDGATNVVLEDLIPTNTTYVPGSLVITAGANAGPMTDLLDEDQAEFTGSGVRFQLGVGATGTPSPQGGSLAPGAATTVTFRVQVNPSIIGGTTITNTVVVSYASQTFKVSDSRAATVSIDCPAVDLKIDKTGDVPVVTAGDGVNHTFTITVTNTSTSAANNVVVADTWPAGFVPGTIIPSVGTFTAPDPVTGNFTWTIGTLAGKASATLTAQYTVPASTPQGTQTNKAVVTTSTFDPNPKNNTATFDIDVVQNVDLSLDKVTVSPVIAGQNVSYTITIKNSGKSDVTGASVSDPFAGVLSNVSWMAVFTKGSGTMSGTGNISEFIDLEAGGQVVYSVTGLLASSAFGSLVNTAKVTSPFDSAEDTVTDEIGRNVNLELDKVTIGSVVAGQTVTYTITITNDGKSDVTGALVSDPFAGVLSGVTWTAVFSGGATDSGTGDIAETIDLPAGGSVVYTVTGLLASSATGSLVNTAIVTSPFDSDSDTVTDPIDRNVDLSLDKVTVTPVVAGQLVSYTIAISNSGKSDVTGALVSDPFVGVLSGVTWTAVFSGGSGNTSGSGNISESIDLSAGGSVLYSVTGLLASSAFGSLVNTATVTSPFDTATDTVTDEIAGVVDLTLTKSGDITYLGGGFLNFTVVVTNLGPSFASGVRLVDALPAGVVNWSWTVTYSGAGSGTADGSPDSVTDSTAGIDKLMNLAVTGTATFLIKALTDADFKSDIANTATATIGEESATATFKSAYDGPINPTSDVAALILGTDDGCGIAPWVRVVDPITGTILSQFLAYEPGFRGGVRVTSGDMDGDDIAEIIVAPGRNRIGQIRVFTPQGVELKAFRTFPFGPAYRGGVEVAVGDVDGDNDNDIIAGMSTGAGMVSVFGVTPGASDPVANVPFRSFRAFPAPYANGTMVAAGDFGTYFNGVKTSPAPDGVAEIVTGTNAGIRAWTRIWDVSVTPKVVRGAFVIAPGFRGGVTLSTARWDGDAIDDLIVGAGVGGFSVIEVYSGATGVQLSRVTAFAAFFKANARVFAAALDLTGDGTVDNLYGVKGLNGGGGARGVRAYARSTGTTSQLTSSPLLAPPLRIAPITLRVVTGG